jgi:hypothetical protein
VRSKGHEAILTNQLDVPYYADHKQNGTTPAMDWKHWSGEQQLKLEPGSNLVNMLTLNPSHPREPEVHPPKMHMLADSLENGKDTPNHQSDPFNPTWVEVVLKAIKIREGLMPKQTKRVRDMITEYASCFVLSIHKVILAKDATLCLDIPEGTELPTKARQQMFTPPQWCYLHKKILKMLDVGIIECTDPVKIKCMSPTTLGQKQHDGAGLTLEEL